MTSTSFGKTQRRAPQSETSPKYTILQNEREDEKYYFDEPKSKSGYFPECFRALIVRPSGQGKTCL